MSKKIEGENEGTGGGADGISDSTHHSAEMPAPQKTGVFKGPELFTVRHADALMDIAAAEGGHSVRVVDPDTNPGTDSGTNSPGEADESNTTTKASTKRSWALEFTDEHGRVIPRTADYIDL